MAAPHVNVSSVGVSCMSNVHAEFIVAERRPVVALTRSVSPLLVVGFFNCSENKTCAITVFALLDSESIVSVGSGSNMSSSRVKEPNFIL